jgi:hypothetical protein
MNEGKFSTAGLSSNMWEEKIVRSLKSTAEVVLQNRMIGETLLKRDEKKTRKYIYIGSIKVA